MNIIFISEVNRRKPSLVHNEILKEVLVTRGNNEEIGIYSRARPTIALLVTF